MTWNLHEKFNVENYQGSVTYFVEDVFTKEEINKLLENTDNEESIKALTLNSKESKHRRSDVKWLEPENYDFYYRKLTDVINYVNNNFYHYNLSYIERLQYTEYDASYDGYYNWHTDNYIAGDQPHNIRKLSFSLLLADYTEYSGGELMFKYDSTPDKVENIKKGTIVFFPSCVLHKVSPVTKGTRKSLVGWIRGSAWR